MLRNDSPRRRPPAALALTPPADDAEVASLAKAAPASSSSPHWLSCRRARNDFIPTECWSWCAAAARTIRQSAVVRLPRLAFFSDKCSSTSSCEPYLFQYVWQTYYRTGSNAPPPSNRSPDKLTSSSPLSRQRRQPAPCKFFPVVCRASRGPLAETKKTSLSDTKNAPWPMPVRAR